MGTNKTFFSDTTEMAFNGDFGTAITATENAKDIVYKLKDRVMYFLDLGMLLHYQGEYERSNAMLEQAERAIEELYTKSISKAALSLLLNDNALDYAGEDYEDIYINIFKSLNYIHCKDNEAAFVEVRRVNEKLTALEDKYARLSSGLNTSKDAKIKLEAGKNRFFNSALARYLSLLLYRNSGKWDDVRIDADRFRAAWEEQGSIYNFDAPDISAGLQPDGAAHLNLFCFTGLSPDKRSKTWWIRTFKDHIFIGESKESLSGEEVLNYADMFYWKDVEDNLFFKFEIPLFQPRPSNIYRMEVLIDEKSYRTHKVESIDKVAEATFAVKKPLVYLKTILRTVSKGLLAKQGKDKMDKQFNNDFLSSLAAIGTDIAVSATEQADLRISHFFPKVAYIADIPLSTGTHQITINYYNKFGSIIYSDNRGKVEITPDKLNIIESICLQ
ncbi:MAG: hypothetical protein K9N06_02620 [Candidatus Cloacimonetes bacterium]|nr:hypothetical protein [Candidatus Cloacimonadota bacterium]